MKKYILPMSIDAYLTKFQYFLYSKKKGQIKSFLNF